MSYTKQRAPDSGYGAFDMNMCQLKTRSERRTIHFIAAWVCCFFFFMPPLITFSQETSVTIGTGGGTGIYYPTGRTIASIVNQSEKKHGFRVRFEATGGSVFNVNAIMMGDLEFGIVQSDRHYQAWNGLKNWKGRGPQKLLRSICSFHSESVVLVAAVDSGIKTLNDLVGKTVNIGNPGSGPRGNAVDAMQSCGIDWRSRVNAEGIRAVDSAGLLQSGRIDAFFYTVGHPNDSILEATRGKRKVRFISLAGDCIDKLIRTWPYYAKTLIPIHFYPFVENKTDVKTFGVKATLCSSINISEKVVYTIVKEIFQHLEAFKKGHPAYGTLTPNNMLEALSAPLHPGAVKYYREAGIKIPESIPKQGKY